MAKKRGNRQLFIDGRMMFYLVLMLLAACLLIFHSYIFGNDVMVFGEAGSDTRQQYLMWYNSIVNHIRAGRFSLWDATNGFGGTMYNYYLFQPALVIVYAIGVIFGPQVIPYLMVYVIITNIILSGIFCYLMLSVWDMDERAKIPTAFLYAFNGYLVVWGQHYGLGAACVWLPLLLMMMELSLRNKKMYPWVAFASALTILSGYYQGYMIMLGMAIYATARILVYAGGSVKEKLLSYVLTGFSLFFGLLMGAVNLLPSAKSLQVTSRLGSGESLLSRFIRNLAPYEKEYYRTLIYRLLGNNLQGTGADFLGDANYYEAINLCMGALLIILGVQFLPLFFRKHRQIRERIAVILGMLISLFMILVKAGSLVFNGFAYAFSRHSFLLLPVAAMMMSWTLSVIIRERRINTLLLSITGLALLAFYAKAYANYKEQVYEMNAMLLLLGALAAAAGLYLYTKGKFDRDILAVLLIGTVFVTTVSDVYLSYHGRISVEKTDTAFFAETWDENSDTVKALAYIRHTDDQFYRIEKDYYTAADYLESMAQGYSGISTYNSQQNRLVQIFVDRLWPELWTKYDRNHLYYTDALSKDKAALLSSLVGLKYLLSHWEIVRLPGFEKIGQEGDVIIFRNKNAENAASFYTRSVTEETYETWTKKYGEIRDILPEIVITAEPADLDVGEEMPEDLQKKVAGNSTSETTGSALAGKQSAAISLTSPDSDSVLTGTVDAPDDGILMIAVPFQEGWSAYVDGEKAEMTAADYCFTGLRVTAGRHSFTLRYAAPLFKEGLIISAAAWLLWLVVCLLLRRRR